MLFNRQRYDTTFLDMSLCFFAFDMIFSSNSSGRSVIENPILILQQHWSVAAIGYMTKSYRSICTCVPRMNHSKIVCGENPQTVNDSTTANSFNRKL